MRIKFKWQMLSLEVLLGICLIFWLIKPGVAYKSVAYKKRVFWLHMRIGLSTKLAKLPNVIFYKLLFSYYKICLCLMGILLILLPLNKESIGLKVFPYFRSRRLKVFWKTASWKFWLCSQENICHEGRCSKKRLGNRYFF